MCGKAGILCIFTIGEPNNTMHLATSTRFHRTEKRTWSLLDHEGKVLGSLIKPHWYSSDRELVVAGGLYALRAKKRWSSELALFFGDVPLWTADLAWDRIRIMAVQGGTTYILRRKQWFSNEYHLLDLHGTVRARITTRMNWSDFEREPELVATDGEPVEPMLLLFAAHAIHVQHERTAGTAIGA
ncbi:MAG: hypothetical protein IT225_02130 [Flavobacteriales bacterium]|jgi:hypothetical protein|nr:hypothetical protein [Flavobacteriales bacterium]